MSWLLSAANLLSIGGTLVAGDENAGKVLESLTNIATIYGEHFILLQFLPYIRDVVGSELSLIWS